MVRKHIQEGDRFYMINGLQTTPLPRIDYKREHMFAKAITGWLTSNAKSLARSQKNDFMLHQIECIDPKVITIADEEMLCIYLFGAQYSDGRIAELRVGSGAVCQLEMFG